jgi:ribonuclease-3
LRADSRLLYRSLGYEFRDPQLLKRALSHRSAGASNNERLEFLGDAVLGSVIAEALYERFPQADEGDLSRMRALLVKGDSLAGLARSIDLGRHLRLGEGTLRTGGQAQTSILADALEAVFGAVCLETGYTGCRDLILRLFSERLRDLDPEDGTKDPKTLLQEHLQGHGLALPKYTLVESRGADHARHFTVCCVVTGLAEPVTGEGTSRRRAEQAAARAAMECLQRV